MGVRENKVERYLDARVVDLGGITRKWVSPGRDGVPDRIVRLFRWPTGVVAVVEVKTDDGKVSPCQAREQARLNEAGMMVYTVYGSKGVDALIHEWVNA